MADIAKYFKCSDCQTRVVVLHTSTGSFIPVEAEQDRTYLANEIFDSSVHTSHLKNCLPLARRWEKLKKMFLKAEERELGMIKKQILR